MYQYSHISIIVLGVVVKSSPISRTWEKKIVFILLSTNLGEEVRVRVESVSRVFIIYCIMRRYYYGVYYV